MAHINWLVSDYFPIHLEIRWTWLSVCLFPINVITAEPITGPIFLVNLHTPLGKVNERFQIFLEKIHQYCLFVSIENQNGWTHFWNSYEHIFRHCISWSKLFKGKNIKLSWKTTSLNSKQRIRLPSRLSRI